MTQVSLSERVRAANNPNAPQGDLTLLGQDEDSRVRWQVARNPYTPPDVLTSLSQDGHWGVRRAVTMNPSSPFGIWIQEGPFRVFP